MSDADIQAPAPDRRRARGDRSRAVVLEHAAAIASTDGLEGLTIGRLASEAGIAKGNIQVLFGDKEALQLAVIDWVGQRLETSVYAQAIAEESPLKRLTGLVVGWFDFVERRELPGGCFMNAVASEFRCRPGAVRDKVASSRAAKRDRYVACLEAARDAGEIRADVDAEQAAFELLSFQALANIATTIGDEPQFSRARESSLRLLASLKA